MVLPAEVAFKEVEPPGQILEGDATTFVGVAQGEVDGE
jgi:hypothetical protein